ncbi:DNA topoisomerase [Vibrio splendidus]
MKSILKAISSDHVDVVATNGRLFDLPSDKSDLETISSVDELCPINKNVINRLITKIKEADSVYIGTDDDFEGESIGDHLAQLCKSKPFFRLKIKSITEQGIVESINLASRTIDQSLANRQRTKRVIDRALGYVHSKVTRYDREFSLPGISRVCTPILNILSNSPQTNITIGKKMGDGMLIATGKHLSRSEKETLNTFMDSACKDTFYEGDRKINEFQQAATPWRFNEAVYRIAEGTGLPIVDTIDELQSLYESGYISYPRTDSALVNDQAANELIKMLHNMGYSNIEATHIVQNGLFKNKKIIEKETIQEGHEGIIPLSDYIDPSISLDALSPREQCYSMILGNIIESAKANSKVFESKTILNVDPWILNKGILDAQRTEFVYIHRTKTNEAGMLKEPYYPELGSLNRDKILNILKGNGSECIINDLPSDLIIARTMMVNGIGRPSSLKAHVQKIEKLWDSDKCKLMPLAEWSLDHAKTHLPLLVNPNAYQIIERMIHDDASPIKVMSTIAQSEQVYTNNDGGVTRGYSDDHHSPDSPRQEPSQSIKHGPIY